MTSPRDADCTFPRGEVAPVIDRNRCEAKGACVPACPYHVLELGVINAQQRAELTVRGRIKAFFHGGKQAFAVRAGDCRGCALCVEVCPEDAITLKRMGG